MTYDITGKVVSASSEYFDCIDFSKFSVKLYGIRFGSLTELESGSITVSNNGTFSFYLQNDAPAIVAKLIYLSGGEQQVIAQSERFCHNDAIDITFAADISKIGENIFSRIISLLERFNIEYDNIAVIEWTAEQLNELSCITCLNIKTLRRFQAAHRLHKEFIEFNSSLYSETATDVNNIKSRRDIFIPVFFALTNSDFTISIAGLLARSRNQFISLLGEAREKREIALESDLPNSALAGGRNALLFNALDNNSYYDAKLIHLAPISYSEKSSLLDRALDGGGLQSIISSDEAANSAPLKKTMPIITLDAHLQRFPPMLQAAVSNSKIGPSPDYYSLTLLGAELWKNIEAPVSPKFNNKNDYADAIYNSLSAGQPTARLSKNLGSSGLENAAAMKTVLDAHKDFNIEEHSVSSFFTTADGQPNYVPADMANRLQTLQRSVKLTGDTTDLRATKALLDTNLTSAYAITQKGESAFIELMRSKEIDRKAAATIYCRSVAMASTVTLLAAQYMRYEQGNMLMPSSLADPVYDPGGTLPNLPNLEALFGSFNTCTCSDCQSVYSPAAYLTDLLHWLNSSVVCDASHGGKTGFDALMAMTAGTVVQDRRKDIKYLNLNCKNTNTLLPYIDIVNEVLSVNLLPDTGGYPPKNSIDDYKLLQTARTAAEIMVQPEHRFPAAEALLKTSFYPWALPYDAGFDEATVYLKELKKPYASLINDFSSHADQYNTAAWAYAFLLLSPSEAGLINSIKASDTNFWKKYWGFAPAQLQDAGTPKVGPVLKNANLTLDELKEVLSAYYINGAAKIAIVPSAADACDIDNYTFSPKLTAAVADRLMRFLRLKRKTELTIQELDLAIFNHGIANGINEAFLIKLASGMAFAQKYGLSFTDVQMLLNANAYADIFLPSALSSYYKNKMQNPLLPADVIDYFDPASTANVFSTNANSIGNAGKQKLSTVFKVSIPAIKAIIDVTLKSTNPMLSPANLAVIDRYSTLARIFEIEPAELENTLLLLGDPFDTAAFPDTIKALWNFSVKIKDLNNLSVTATELRDIVEGMETNAGAELVWNNIESDYAKNRLANPAKLFASTSPYLPAASADETFFTDAVIENIRLPFKLSYLEAKAIINNYSATWLKDYIADPNGTGTPRNWETRRTAFLPVYRLLKMNASAESVWNDIELAYTKSRLANPSKLFDATAPYLPVKVADETFFSKIIIENLRLPFKLSYANTEAILNNYAATWLQDYIADPNGKGTTRDWLARKTAFLPVYRLLNRIALLAEVIGLKEDGLSKGIDEKIRALASYPGDHFYWVANIFSPTDYKDAIWIKNMASHAAALGMSQSGYLDVIEDYKNNNTSTYSTANDTKIAAFYNLIDEKSSYRSLSVFEFTQTFLRAKAIANPADDLEEVMEHFDVIFNATKVLNIKVTDAWSWIWNTAWTGYANVSAFSQDIRRVLNAAYPVFADWSERIVPIQNEFRSRLRDALVAYYIGTRGFKNENAIYAYYLLDTQMAPCNQTSRVVAAVSSVQLLVHRALLGLEPRVCMDDDDRNEWEWRKNYRVWEANRKVFLYPENWIDPSLRNNKSTIFKAAEDLLQQDEINQQNSENAFAGYLTSLNEVAHLDIRATYVEQLDAPASDCCRQQAAPQILHVFARSWNPPYIYYYRNQKNNVWSAWEKMELEIDSDHLIPVMFNRKLYVFFPLFVEKQHHEIKNSINGQDVPVPYMEVKMCYTKLDFGKWSNKKVLNGTLLAGHIASINAPNSEAGLINRLGKFDPNGRGDGINSKIQSIAYRGNVVWDSNQLKDFAYVSMKKEAFYFWPEVDSNGDLTINCRRDFDEGMEGAHDGYTELAYEWGFKIGACDEKVTIVPPVIHESSNAQRYLARPYMTLPYAQQMKRGRDKAGFDPANPGTDAGLWVKTASTFYPNSSVVLQKTNGEYVLTYPAQFRDNTIGQPYFFADTRHSLYVDSSRKITLHEHPFTCKMLEALNRFGIEGLLNSKDVAGLKRQAASISFFNSEYNPTTIVPYPYPVRDYDFSGTGAYSLYNWEVFFHSVSLIARQLRLNNKFEDAVKWINYIFDPSNRDMSLQDLRYWKIKPFLIDVTKGISYYMRLLSAPNLNAAERAEKKQWEAQIEAWRDQPFDPHLIASMRPRAYMLWTVMELIQTLTDWGDYLFRQDTTESVNEAINLYILASEILGERPKKVDRPSPPDYCYGDISNGLNAFSNVAIGFENYMTSLHICQCDDALALSDKYCNNSSALTTLPELFFCIPDNPRMTEMWDRVEDRLFKIRNCMNIEGKKRQLALFAPPIDPALLVRATAMGLDLSDVLADLAAAPPHYRFSYLLNRANDFTNEVKSLGSQLLTALEKKDGEELSLLRQLHEQNILKASRTIKEMQLEEAKQNYTTLQYSKNLIQIRLDDYKNREYKNSREENAQRQTQLAEGFMFAEQGVRLVAGLLNLIPDLYTGASGLGPSTKTKLGGGQKFSVLTNAGASALGIISSVNRNKASMSLTYAGYDRRQEEWNLQIKSAAEELLQVDRQLLSAEIRIAVAEKELENHDLQAEQSAEMYNWLKTKYTNQTLYTWMAGQLKTLHRKAYELAYDMAKLAQQAFYKDLGAGIDTPKINFGNWDSSRAGFFAGERLSIQLRELETAYMQHNTRDYELSKNISLALLDPLALEDLKMNGSCEINIPELLFDLDYTGHYFRKIRSVALSIPGIAGPYTSIAATLTLNNHRMRKVPALGDLDKELGYGESIATSSAQNDSGVFELNFKDERYMPFEHKGAVSSWTLELSQITKGTSTVRAFDFNTISDVIMHMNYTAKFDGNLNAAVKANLNTNLPAIAAAINNLNNNPNIIPGSTPPKGLQYAINLRHDMPDAWHQLKATGSATLKIEKRRLPYILQALSLTAGDMTVIAYTTLNTAASYAIKINSLAPLPLSNVSGTTVYKETIVAATAPAIVLDTNFTITTNAITSTVPALPLGNTNELVIIVKISVS
ncbi:MAG TPA: neuraminidase-like domain-containing protein [Flavobacterium sp.]|nr:neuraminidase-like domain-containing protein [Flavobacterium sp.]